MRTPEPIKDKKKSLFERRSWLISIAAFGQSRTPLYIAYIFLIFALLLYLFAMAAYAIYVAAPNKVLMASALHMLLITTFVIFVTTYRQITNRSINEMNDIIMSGIYEYEGEDLDQNQLEMKARIEKQINKISDVFSVMFASGGITNITIFPWTAFLVENGDQGDGLYNPYLPPYLIYMPFSTRTFHGYCLAYVINILLVIYLYGITLCWLDMYIQSIGLMKAQFKILNYSIQNIQARAYTKFKEINRTRNKEYSPEVLYEENSFQKCLYTCFRSNVRHHQALLRFRKALQPFIGAGLLDMYLMAALIYAASLYLIVQDLPINQLINLIVMLFTEQSKLFIMCYLGEAITDESGGLLRSLYNTPWIQCNESLNKAIKIMMCNTLEPLKIKASFIDKPADIKAYGDFMTTMYKIVNLVRQSDVT